LESGANLFEKNFLFLWGGDRPNADGGIVKVRKNV